MIIINDNTNCSKNMVFQKYFKRREKQDQMAFHWPPTSNMLCKSLLQRNMLYSRLSFMIHRTPKRQPQEGLPTLHNKTPFFIVPFFSMQVLCFPQRFSQSEKSIQNSLYAINFSHNLKIKE